MARAYLAAIAFAAGASACAIAPGASEQERALIEAVGGREILPQSRAQRDAIADAPLVAQAAFWAAEYEKNPADREAAAAYARTSRQLGQPGRAIEAANRALALYPDDVALLVALGAALVADGRAAAAVNPLERAMALDPRHVGAPSVLGTALDHLGRHADAQGAYARAMEIAGETPTILANLGLSHVLAGSPGTGADILARAAALPGADARVRQNLALALALDGRLEEAEALAQQDLDRERARQSIDYVRRLRATGPAPEVGARALGLDDVPPPSLRLEPLTPKPAGRITEAPLPPPVLRAADAGSVAPPLRTASGPTVSTAPPPPPLPALRTTGPMLADLEPALRTGVEAPLEIGGPEEPDDQPPPAAAPPIPPSLLRLRQ